MKHWVIGCTLVLCGLIVGCTPAAPQAVPQAPRRPRRLGHPRGETL